jgi:predicted GH43/DUF377 family glycosyl hydrolase
MSSLQLKEIMKKLIFNLILSLIILVLSGCKQDNFPAPLKFKGYENNPVLIPGEPGSWDDLYVMHPFVLKDNELFYMFYTAYSRVGARALGLATSTDGYHFAKYEKNPILEGDKTGFDAFGVAQAQVLKQDAGWVLYYNAREIAGYSSGPTIGRATSRSLIGPWIRSEEPVLKAGKKGEWDSDFIYLGPILELEDGSYLMYYAGGDDLISFQNFFIGMATSKDGISWKKYNDPATVEHPFKDSDPVLKTSPEGWDSEVVLTGTVLKLPQGYTMYFYGSKKIQLEGPGIEVGSIGYATSKDGVHWDKYRQNPVYTLQDDPYTLKLDKAYPIIHSIKFLNLDSIYFMYYDYGARVGEIGMAKATID